MIYTLHRYIFRELCKVFGLATLAMTLILNFGMLFREIQDFGVTPGQVIHLMFYLLPITLTFVLPMSALFAASMVYGRFAADRELDACRASGISLWMLVYPGLCLAILVAAVNLLLSFHIAPAFIHRSERSVKANAEQILFRNLQRKGFYNLPGSNYYIYADKADPEQKIIEGVIIIGKAKNEFNNLQTVERAKVEIDSRSQVNRATIIAQNLTRMDELEPASTRQVVLEQEFPPLLSDNIKFQKLHQLKVIRADKMQFYPIRQMAVKARSELITELLCGHLNQAFAADSNKIHLESADGSRAYELSAGKAVLSPSQPQTVELLGPVVLTEIDRIRNQVLCRYQSASASCGPETDQLAANMQLNMDSPAWDRGGGVKGVSYSKFVNNLIWPTAIANAIGTKPLLDVLQNVGQTDSVLSQPEKSLLSQVQKLKTSIHRVNNEIDAEIHSRLVLGLGCVGLILTGIALGISLRGGHLLSAFGASAVPAGVVIIFILAGRQLTKNPSVTASLGILTMWTGFVLLLCLTLYLYRRLLRT